MAAYTPSLRLTLPVTGTDDGTWGDTVNNGITSLTDAAIAGTATVVQGDVANYTLTSSSGATDEARNMFLNITGALTAARNVICPTASKLYFIKNSTTGGFAVTLKTSGGTGISVPAGSITALYCDGTNVVDAITYANIPVINATTVDTTNLEVTNIKAKDGTASITLADTTGIATFSKATVISTSDATNAALRITQTGAGNAFVVEDSTSPDTTPFIVNSTGRVLIARDTASVLADGILQVTVQGATLPGVMTNTGSTSFRPHWSLAVADTEVAAIGTTNTLLNTYVGGASRMTISSLGSTVLYPVTGAGSGLTVSGTNLSGATTNISVFSNTTFGSAATTRGEGFQTTLGTEAATFTLGELGHFKATQGTLGLNSVVTSQYGFYANSTLVGATNNYGFYSEIAAAAGRFNFYAAGTATNYFSGDVGIGTNAPSSKLQITKGEATAYNGTATDGQLAAGSTLFIQQTSGTNTGVAQIVFQPRTTFPYNRIVSSGGSAPFMTFVTNNAEAMRITSAGYVGVGTTSPSTKLDVLGTPVATSGGLVTIYDTSATGINSTLGSLVWASGPGTDFYIGKKSESAIGSLSFGDAGSGTEFMRLDSSGNLGLGVTPSAWGGSSRSLDVAAWVSFAQASDGAASVAFNAYESSSGVWNYKISALNPARYDAQNGGHRWYNAPSGTAGNAITFTQAMTLDASGNFMVGATAALLPASNRGNITVNGATDSVLAFGIAASTSSYIYSSSSYLEIAAEGSKYIAFRNNGAERMRLDSAGNLGLGVTPSAWTPTKVLQLGGEFLAYSGVTGYLTTNTYYGSLGFTYNGTGFATRYEQTSGKHVWYNAPSGTAGNAITFTQAMTLDTAGSLLVGTTTSPGNNQKIYANGGITAVNGALNVVGTGGFFNSANKFGVDTNGVGASRLYSSGSNSSTRGSFEFHITDSVGTLDTTAMTLDASGNLLVGTTTNGDNYKTVIKFNNSTISGLELLNGNEGTNNFIACSNGIQYRFLVLSSGNVQNLNNSYGAISDIKLKENIIDATPKLNALNQVRIVNYNLIGDAKKQIGVVAQELEQIFPGMIDEAPDRDMEGNDLGTTTKSVKYSVFVPMLIKAMQEQQAMIEELKTRLAAAGI